MHQDIVPFLIEKIEQWDIAENEDLHNNELLAGFKNHVFQIAIDDPHIAQLGDNRRQSSLHTPIIAACQKCGHPYDFIILDPPAFTKARRTVDNAMRGYKEINYRAMKLLPRGGYLATASCSHFATEELFIKMLKAAAKDAHRQLRQIEVKQQAPDHPILWGVPETNYLKFFLFQVI